MWVPWVRYGARDYHHAVFRQDSSAVTVVPDAARSPAPGSLQWNPRRVEVFSFMGKKLN